MLKLRCLGRDNKLPRRVTARFIGWLYQGAHEGYRYMSLKVTARKKEGYSKVPRKLSASYLSR